jgi:hypothetical protein
VPVVVVLGLVGFGGQLINSALGMGYGVTSTTVLLALGTTPALASATVNFSQVGSQLVSGLAHWRFGNVDWRIVWRIGLPGAVGAFAGATVLSALTVAAAGPLMALLLLVLGGYLLVRFTLWGTGRGQPGKPLRSRFLAPLGLLGGFLNASGGGGWGPVGTTALLASGRAAPRTVIGSISASEFLVVVAGSAGFLLGLGRSGIELGWVVAMLAGGVLAAPIAAWLARHIPPRLLGSLVGGLIVVMNARTLLPAAAVPAAGQAATLGALMLVWAAAVGWSVRAYRRQRPVPARSPALAQTPADQLPPAAPVISSTSP